MKGLTPQEHEHSAAVDEAAKWLATSASHERPSPIIPGLRSRFGLTALEATEACREAALIRARSV